MPNLNITSPTPQGMELFTFFLQTQRKLIVRRDAIVHFIEVYLDGK